MVRSCCQTRRCVFMARTRCPPGSARGSANTTTKSMAVGWVFRMMNLNGCVKRERFDMNDATESGPNGRILLEMRDHVAVMTLNDPSVLNAFGFKLRNDITWALDQLEASG